MDTYSSYTQETLSYSASLQGHDHVHVLMEPYVTWIDKVFFRYFFFHFFFILLFFGEWVGFFSFFSFLYETSLLAFAVAALFFTAFSYVVLRLYFQAKKQSVLLEIRDDFLSTCKEWLQYNEEEMDHHIALANLSTKFAMQLKGKEYTQLKPPSWLSFLFSSMQKLSSFWFGYDYYQMKELLLEVAVKEHIKVVKQEPTNLEAHANLANAYVILSNLYVPPKEEENHWSKQKLLRLDMEEKFREISEKAIEELKILHDYAPNDPWVHAQLAYSYHDLQMPLEEIREYETIYRIRPEDKQTLLRLGILYFEQGFNAKGLRVYEELRRSDPKKAEILIKYYGACQT